MVEEYHRPVLLFTSLDEIFSDTGLLPALTHEAVTQDDIISLNRRKLCGSMIMIEYELTAVLVDLLDQRLGSTFIKTISFIASKLQQAWLPLLFLRSEPTLRDAF